MIPVFLEAALRSLLAGMAVAAGLRLFRVHNVLARKAAWGLVLVSALAMPLLLPVTAKWHLPPASLVLPAHPMTLLEELQAKMMAQGGSGRKIKPQIATTPQSDLPKAQVAAAPDQGAADDAARPASGTSGAARGAKRVATARLNQSVQPVSRGAAVEPAPQVSPSIRNIAISPAAVALALYGAVAAFFLLRLALGLWMALRLWRGAQPVTAAELGRGAASLAMRASSRVASPVTIGSAVLLPANYRSWNNEKLRIVLAHERSHIRQGDFYLQVLASFYAALVWFSPLGWWLKYELAELAEAISDRAAIEQASSDTSYARILLEFAAAPRKTQIQIGVAMARPGSLSRRIERLFNDHILRQCFAGGRRALVTAALVPVALIASTMLVHVEAASGAKAPAPPAITVLASPAAALTGAVPEVTAATHANEMVAALPAPASGVVPASPSDGAVMQEGGPSFDRTLSVSGNAQLTINTGSGNIHISRGSGSQIQIHGQIRVSHEGSQEQARQIAENPPIVQEGNAIVVGKHDEQWHGISIDYRIEAPAGVTLEANSGSGNIEDEGVGQNAKLQTGSGDITATSLEGPFKVMTGSGNIVAAQTGEGDVYAQTGSGNIELKDIHGGFRGETGSGDIKASGTPSAKWDLQTGSGNIELWTGNAPLSLDASTGSGSVSTEHEMVMQGNLDRHHIRGNLNGGGPTVRAETGSGDVHVH